SPAAGGLCCADPACGHADFRRGLFRRRYRMRRLRPQEVEEEEDNGANSRQDEPRILEPNIVEIMPHVVPVEHPADGIGQRYRSDMAKNKRPQLCGVAPYSHPRHQPGKESQKTKSSP